MQVKRVIVMFGIVKTICKPCELHKLYSVIKLAKAKKLILLNFNMFFVENLFLAKKLILLIF